MRAAVRELQKVIDQVAAAFMSPPDVRAEASEAEVEMAEDADQLLATVIGGLGAQSVTTGAVIGGIREAEALPSTYESAMTPMQAVAVRELLETLRVV